MHNYRSYEALGAALGRFVAECGTKQRETDLETGIRALLAAVGADKSPGDTEEQTFWDVFRPAVSAMADVEEERAQRALAAAREALKPEGYQCES